MLDPSTLQIWDRERDEPAQCWFAFKRWRDMKPKPTYASLAEDCDVTPQTIGNWAASWSWKVRGAEYDRWLDQAAQQAAQETEVLTVTEMRKLHLGSAGEARRAADEALRLLITDLKSGERAMTPQAISRMLDIATKLERLTLGQATEIQEGADYSKLSDEEFDALRKLQGKAEGT